MDQLVAFLATLTALGTTDSEYRYPSMPGLVGQHGRLFHGAPLPDHLEPGELGECFYNAAQLALGDPRYLYCEGWAQHRVLPVEHAWCYDTHTGTVIDPTWRDTSAATVYCGVVLPADTLRHAVLRNEHWGVLVNDWRTGHIARNGIATIDTVGDPIEGWDGLVAATKASFELARRHHGEPTVA